MPPRNLDQLTRVYGPTTWDVYARLDASLDPTGPDSLHDLAAEYLRAGDLVLDAGCRDAAHLIELVGANDIDGVGIDPVEIHIERARAAVEAAGLGDRINLHQGVMHDLPYEDGHFDFVWCRDVLEQVDDLDGALTELVRVMKPQARLLVYTAVATELLDGRRGARHCYPVTAAQVDVASSPAKNRLDSRSTAWRPSPPSVVKHARDQLIPTMWGEPVGCGVGSIHSTPGGSGLGKLRTIPIRPCWRSSDCVPAKTSSSPPPS